MSTYTIRLISFITMAGLTICPPAITAQQQYNPTQIVANILQAYGGREALERVRVVKHSGTIQSHRLGVTGSMQRLLQLPGNLRVDIDYPGGPREQRITTSEGAWRDGKPAKTAMHTAMSLQAARFRLPLLLTETPVTVLGEEQGLLRLKMRLTATTSQEIFVDPKTWHIVRTVGYMTMQGLHLDFSAEYSDFRKVDGVLFAHREELTAMGRATGVAVLKHIEVNAKTTAEDFTPRQISK